MPSCGTITTENLKTSITTELNSDELNDYIPYLIPHFIPGDGFSTEMKITTENLKTSITTECNGI